MTIIVIWMSRRILSISYFTQKSYVPRSGCGSVERRPHTLILFPPAFHTGDLDEEGTVLLQYYDRYAVIDPKYVPLRKVGQ